jgi:molybdopterin-containing oxidoreductase family iron-sulfur binding subunit
MNPPRASLDLEALRRRLKEGGPTFWRSLEEVAETPEFLEALRREFPREAAVRSQGLDRREFVALLGASLALAGLAGCSREPAEKIVPFVRQPEGLVPGKPIVYATAMPDKDGAIGLLVKTVMGRPVKIEGNPRHPASLGSADAIAQASILSLYDPDRSQSILHDGRPATWSSFLAGMSEALAGLQARQGAGFRILTESVLSPSLHARLLQLLERWPNARWHRYEPLSRQTLREGSRMVFGQDVEPRFRLSKADVLVSLDSDFLNCGPGHERYARAFADRRREGGARGGLNRLYTVESTPTLTGAAADHRWTMKAGQVARIAEDLARALGLRLPERKDDAPGWVETVARDLRAHRGRSLVVAGPNQSSVVHALACGMNAALENIGATVTYGEPAEFDPPGSEGSLESLVQAMAAGDVQLLFMLGGNPVYTAPADLDFTARLDRVPLRVHLSPVEDETSWRCHWHLPEAHFLESWGDARAYDGSISLLQPTIAPLYGGRSALEVLAAVSGDPGRSGYDLLRDFWKTPERANGFETFWSVSLHEGSVTGTSTSPRRVRPRPDWTASLRAAAAPPDGLEAIFQPDPTIGDGRHANNAWLQELPKPLTHLTWDNAALFSPATAERLALSNGDRVELSLGRRSLEAPVWILPGHPDDAVTLPLGYGRSRAGKVGNHRGFNAYALRSTQAPGYASGLLLRKTGGKTELACTQLHHAMEGRDLVRTRSARESQGETPPPAPSLYPPVSYPGPAWGMVIDLGACSGCNACVVACQAENNIPVVGKTEVLRGREMHWIRVDRYFEGDPENPAVHHQPVPCMHCEEAPCEAVCPVAATVHSSEGLNQMVYNRCVGTRYCSNNCPYKVRRFNFFDYPSLARAGSQSLVLLNNPDVTVRERGVMEKCSYCVQRIVGARIEAEKEGRPLREGEVVTACQATCPSQAIAFGDLNNRRSKVAGLRSSPLHYGLLEELNTRPRTTYLAKVSNPNPEIHEG